MTKREACDALNAAGLVAGPVATDAEVVADPHLAVRHMLVEHPRTDGVDAAGAHSRAAGEVRRRRRGTRARVPWVGEHTDAVLGDELGLGAGDWPPCASEGVIG